MNAGSLMVILKNMWVFYFFVHIIDLCTKLHFKFFQKWVCLKSQQMFSEEKLFGWVGLKTLGVI